MCLAGIQVADAREAYAQSTANGAVGVQEPTVLRDEATGTEQCVAEIRLYGDCLLRFVSGTYQVSPSLARYPPSPIQPQCSPDRTSVKGSQG